MDEIDKQNRIIANFMCSEKFSDGTYDLGNDFTDFIYDFITGRRERTQYFKLDQLKYSYDWNWIIPVVKKLFKEYYTNEFEKDINTILETLLLFDIEILNREIASVIKKLK